MQLSDSCVHRTFNAMVARSNRARPTTKDFELHSNLLKQPAFKLVFLCLWETHGNIQNKKPQQTATQKTVFSR